MRKKGARMQSEVLAVLKRHGKPLTAYEVLAKMRKGEAKLAPPTIYRALSALIEERLAHRLESLNAFVACQCAGHGPASVLSICDDCGAVEEHVDVGILQELSVLAGESGFRTTRHVIEVHGLCGACVGKDSR